MDPRLLDCSSQPEIAANFHRILAKIDALEARISHIDSMTLVYDANGGTGDGPVPGGPYVAGSNFPVQECTFTPPEGMEFASWNDELAGTGTSYTPGDTFTVGDGYMGSTLTLYATWADAPEG